MSRRVEFVWPDELVDRVDAARGDVSRSKFVQRAAEAALAKAPSVYIEGFGSVPADSKPYKLPPSESAPKPPVPKSRAASTQAEKTYSCPKPNCIFVSSEPGVCVHHRTERLR